MVPHADAQAAAAPRPPGAMLDLDDPDRDSAAENLDAAGGFAWWYVEASDHAGNGVVVIWSFGLPFLPGACAHPTPARARPSIHVSIYERGEPALYALCELDADDASWSGRSDGDEERWRFGRSTIASKRAGRQTQLELKLDIPVSGGEVLRGTLHLLGATARWTDGARTPPPAHAHLWTPMVGAAFATARLRCAELRFALSGRAYHDRNTSSRSMRALGIERWLWGRAALCDHDRVFYALWPEGGGEPLVLAYRLGADGAVSALPGATMRLCDPHLTRWAMPSFGGVEVFVASDGDDGDATVAAAAETRRAPWLSLEARAAVDDGPFYLRRQCAAAGAADAGDAAPAAGAHGTFEVIVPRRIDLGLFRPLVRMRVHRDGAANSMWLPLFEGPRRGRWARWLRVFSADAERAAATPR